MPRRRYYRRRRPRYRRRRYFGKRKRNYRKRTTTNIVRSPSFIPDRIFVKLNWAVDAFHLVNASPNGELILRGNSPFDPEFATGPGQTSALGYDQWAQMYSKYRVHKSAITMKILTTDQAAKYSITPSTDPLFPNTYFDAIQFPYTKNHIVSGIQYYHSISNSMYSKKILGLKSLSYDDATASLVTSNPLTQWYWLIKGTTYSNLGTMSSYVQIKVTYWVEFFDRQDTVVAAEVPEEEEIQTPLNQNYLIDDEESEADIHPVYYKDKVVPLCTDCIHDLQYTKL